MTMTSVGVNIKGADLYMAAIVAPMAVDMLGSVRPNAFGKVSPSQNLVGEHQLLDLKNRVQADLREWGASTVTLLDTTKYGNWVYAHALKRIFSISALMLACADESIVFRTIKPAEAGRVVLSPKLDKIDPRQFGLSGNPTYWTTGLGEAFAAAATSIQKSTSTNSHGG